MDEQPPLSRLTLSKSDFGFREFKEVRTAWCVFCVSMTMRVGGSYTFEDDANEPSAGAKAPPEMLAASHGGGGAEAAAVPKSRIDQRDDGASGVPRESPAHGAPGKAVHLVHQSLQMRDGH